MLLDSSSSSLLIVDVQEKLLNERVVGFVKKDETSMDELSDRISKLIKSS